MCSASRIRGRPARLRSRKIDGDWSSAISNASSPASRTSPSWSARRITIKYADKKFLRRIATEVTIDNRTSEQYTVIDVFTQDRVGLLFAITYTLFRLDCGFIWRASRTNADQALDVFYISDRQGTKIIDIAAQRELREKLLERLEDRPRGNCRRGAALTTDDDERGGVA